MEQSFLFEDFTPHCDLDLDLVDRNPNVLPDDIPGHDDTPTCQGLSGSDDNYTYTVIVRTNYIFPEDLKPHRDLALEHSNPKLPHNALARDDAPLSTVQIIYRTKV